MDRLRRIVNNCFNELYESFSYRMDDERMTNNWRNVIACERSSYNIPLENIFIFSYGKKLSTHMLLFLLHLS